MQKLAKVPLVVSGDFERGASMRVDATTMFPHAMAFAAPVVESAIGIALVFVAQQVFLWRATRPGAVERLLESTGSSIDQTGLRCYEAIMGTSGHIAGALGMMARWDLHSLQAEFPAFSRPLILVAADHDLAVPPRVAERVHAIIPHSRLIRLPGLGHLAHEESPERIADIVRAAVGAGSPVN